MKKTNKMKKFKTMQPEGKLILKISDKFLINTLGIFTMFYFNSI